MMIAERGLVWEKVVITHLYRWVINYVPSMDRADMTESLRKHGSFSFISRDGARRTPPCVKGPGMAGCHTVSLTSNLSRQKHKAKTAP